MASPFKGSRSLHLFIFHSEILSKIRTYEQLDFLNFLILTIVIHFIFYRYWIYVSDAKVSQFRNLLKQHKLHIDDPGNVHGTIIQGHIMS